MRRDVSGHANSDAGAAVDEQIGEPTRKYDRLQGAPVVVRREVDGVLVNVAHHLHGQWSHAAFGVALCSGGIIAGGTKVALTLDQWVAQ